MEDFDMQSVERTARMKSRRIQDLLFFVTLIIAGAFLLWKCQFGIGNNDEAFYLTIPHRLLQGDALFRHEWHLSQMAGFLLLPVYTVVRWMNGGMEGIVLAMRYAAILVQCIAAVYMYGRMRSYSWLGALCSTLSFLLYIPFSIMALSYNSMGILFLLIACLLQLPCKKREKISRFLSGISFAAAVLCCPYLAVLFIGYVFAAFFVFFHLKGKRKLLAKPFLQSFFAFTAGVSILAVAFLTFVLSRASVDAILKALPYMLNDPEHPPVAIMHSGFVYLKAIYYATPWSPVIYLVVFLLFVICVLDHGRKKRVAFYFCVSAACTGALMLSHYIHLDYINMMMWPVNVIAPFLWLLSDKKEVRRIFFLFWIPGIAYSFCLNLSSNQEIFAITSAGSVATAGTILMLGMFVSALRGGSIKSGLKVISVVLGCSILCAQLTAQTDLRYRNVFWESGIDDQIIKLEEGIQAGLYVSAGRAEEYAEVLEKTERMKLSQGTKVLFLSSNPQLYLISDCEMASYSGWLSGVNEASVSRLKDYYRMNPDKLPEVIYMELRHAEYSRFFTSNYGYYQEVFEDGILLKREDANN